MNRNCAGLSVAAPPFITDFIPEFAQTLVCEKPKSSENKNSIFAPIAPRRIGNKRFDDKKFGAKKFGDRIFKNFILAIIIFLYLISQLTTLRLATNN
jgi:hypothetical protein